MSWKFTHNCDNQIINLSNEYGLTYSRYADDLTFSSQNKIPVEFVSKLDELLRKNKYALHLKKTRFMGKGDRQKVTGIVINVKVHPPRNFRRKMRQIFYQAEKWPHSYFDRINQLQGFAAYVNSYNKSLGSSYLRIVKQLKEIKGKTT